MQNPDSGLYERIKERLVGAIEPNASCTSTSTATPAHAEPPAVLRLGNDDVNAFNDCYTCIANCRLHLC